ncbi:acyl-CoA thioesterase [Sphingomonas sp. NPDC092331]|jgi:acyl-CoA hydrolase|uniref:acyl-CoA thioesterase n=1 Tax=unclassified Sphingomonas TaxID=196159 RepID=UPI0031F5CF96
MAGVVRLIDMVFPGDTNHHGTLFGGVALAHMDKVAFLAASRHGRAPFVTAASERIDFAAPALKGELIEATGRVVRTGTRSLDVEVELLAEALLSGERRLCTRGRFTLVAREGAAAPLPPLAPSPTGSEAEPEGVLVMADMVFPPQTNHYGTLFGGDALRMLGKAAFIASTRDTRKVMVMAASDRVDFTTPIHEGEMVELAARIIMRGNRSRRVRVELWAEDLLSARRRRAASAEFVMVATASAQFGE